MVGSVNDWQKEKQFQKLNAQKEERNVKALRNGQERLMSVYDVVVGDILFLEPGEIVPVDGVFLSGHNVRCDESGATGESDAVRKASFDDIDKEGGNGKTDCFMISGSKVVEGVGRYVVTSVGRNSFHGKIMMCASHTLPPSSLSSSSESLMLSFPSHAALQGDSEDTPLQLKLNALAELIAWLGSAAGLLLFVALMIRFFVGLSTNPDRTADDKAQNFISVLIISVTVVVVAVPEGLPLAVTLALAFATRRMTKMNLLVRVLGACETMANATCVCTDKTCTLTTNSMTVVAGSIGVHLKFVSRLDENSARTNANDDRDPEKVSASGHDDDDEKAADLERDQQQQQLDVVPQRKGRLDFTSDMGDINQHVPAALRKLLNESVVVNSTAFEGTDEHGAEGGFVGSKTETALMSWAQAQGWEHWKQVREGADVVQMVPFSSERKCMGVVVRLPGKQGYRLFLKGASEVLAKLATRHVVVQERGAENGDANAEVDTEAFDDETRANISRTIIFYACQSLRTIALCSRDFPSWPPAGAQVNAEGEVEYDDMARDLTLIAITAIEDPLREGVAAAVATCQRAGVMVKMCTGDNVLTARSIASQCGIFSKGGIIMEGPVFRKLTPQQRLEVVPNLQVLARSSPEDKKVLVETLKSMGEVVGVTGDGTNDGPALKTANVGFSMGIAGTEVAKEASDIILMDDNFASIVSAIMWGRCVNDSVRKFLQVRLSLLLVVVVVGRRAAAAAVVVAVEPFADPSLSLSRSPPPAVPALGQHLRRRHHVRLCRRVGRGGVGPHGRPAPLGQPHHGHVRRPRARNRPGRPRVARPPAGPQDGAPHQHQHVGHDPRPGSVQDGPGARPQLCRAPDSRPQRDRRGRAHQRGERPQDAHLQRLCLLANLCVAVVVLVLLADEKPTLTLPLSLAVNMFNCRRLDRHYNIFSRVHKNPYFIVIFFISASPLALLDSTDSSDPTDARPFSSSRSGRRAGPHRQLRRRGVPGAPHRRQVLGHLGHHRPVLDPLGGVPAHAPARPARAPHGQAPPVPGHVQGRRAAQRRQGGRGAQVGRGDPARHRRPAHLLDRARRPCAREQHHPVPPHQERAQAAARHGHAADDAHGHRAVARLCVGRRAVAPRGLARRPGSARPERLDAAARRQGRSAARAEQPAGRALALAEQRDDAPAGQGGASRALSSSSPLSTLPPHAQ